MSSRPPPVPPANRSPKGPGEPSKAAEHDNLPFPDSRLRNIEQQGRQANIKQNTTHQGLQQDR